MFEIQPMHENIMAVKVSGKLTHQDYRDHFIPALEKAIIQHGTICLLLEASDFHGWEWQAAFDDFKTGIKHRKDFAKIAIAGDQAWEENLVRFARFFVNAEVRYFDHSRLDEAKNWLQSK